LAVSDTGPGNKLEKIYVSECNGLDFYAQKAHYFHISPANDAATTDCYAQL